MKPWKPEEKRLRVHPRIKIALILRYFTWKLAIQRGHVRWPHKTWLSSKVEPTYMRYEEQDIDGIAC